jgi:predicted DNA-binding WGR domain protein
MAGTNDTPLFTAYTVAKVNELNFTDILGVKSKTRGSSNKFYHAEIQLEKNGSRAQIYTEYGPTGRALRKEWRHFSNQYDAESEYEKLLRSKRHKGYQDIDVAQRAVGSEESKKITKAVVLTNADHLKTGATSLHPETARFITEIMGATNQFVIKTLKCPLGQLTNAQIDAGRTRLDMAKQVVSSPHNKDTDEAILDITNQFYSLIPHNLGLGSRGVMSELLLDSVQKIAQKEDDLDTLLDAKSIGAVLGSSDVEEKYKSLNAQLNVIDHSSDLFKWITAITTGTRAPNHHFLGRILVRNAWELVRDPERPKFIKRANEIANECGKQVVGTVGRKYEVTVPNILVPFMKRTDIPASDRELYARANVLPLFHGTRTQNLTGIIKNGLMIRPAGVVLCGSMYGNAIYNGLSTKAINYTSVQSSYWAGGKDDRAYIFLNDCALGNPKIASGAYQYSKRNIAPSHSVWAVGGRSGVINDEMMLYDTNQHITRYVIEFECKGGR